MVQTDSSIEQDQMHMMMTQLQDANLRESVMQYIQQTANGLDKNANNNSKTLIETLARESVHNHKTSVLWKSRTKKSVTMGIMAVIFAITVQFLVNYFTNELSKESHVDEEGAMVGRNGKVVQMQLEEMKVGTDGKLFSRQGSMVKTMPSLAKVALASSLPDATLMGLEEIVITSSTGFTLQIKVHGFSRIPVLNSRCGNVVHFYTAWKGRVTLDSTDLSFDDDTAAAFTKAGFDLAVGGRRLSGESSINGFFKSIDELKSSGKWTCADVPLPTLPETGVQRRTMYSLCIDGCKSKHGGTVYGTSLLPQGVVHDYLGSKHPGVYMKTFSTVVESNMWTVQVDRYQQHPGQQLVWISDKKTHRVMKFQVQEGKEAGQEAGVSHRTHCHVAKDASAAFDAARKDPKVDSSLHFQYLGVVEEHGKVMRHFRAWYSDEFENAAFGTSQEGVDYWDDANNLRPMRLMTTGGTVVVFDSVDAVSDSHVETEVEKLGGFGCKDFEGETEEATERVPRMNKFEDLSLEDAIYYMGDGSVVQSDDFVSYLSSVRDPLSVSDKCFDRCRREMDSLRSSKDMCDDGSLAIAMACMQGNGENECMKSDFVNHHTKDCQRNITEDSRGLELQEAADEHELLLTNESLSARNLLFKGTCNSKSLWIQTWVWTNTYCRQTEFEKLGFKLSFTYGLLGGKMGLAIMVVGCGPLNLILGLPLPPYCPIFAKKCVGGGIKVVYGSTCPEFTFSLKGQIFFEYVLVFKLYTWKANFGKLHLGLEVGKEATKRRYETRCWFVSGEGSTRRRYWTYRRRNIRRCTYGTETICDLYVKGLAFISALGDRIRLAIGLVYWVKAAKLHCRLSIDYWNYIINFWDDLYALDLFTFWF